MIYLIHFTVLVAATPNRIAIIGMQYDITLKTATKGYELENIELIIEKVANATILYVIFFV